MNFILYYHGQLKSNGDSKEKHSLREKFHPQLKTLWTQEPLSHFASFYSSPDPEFSIARQIGPYTFVPLICQAFHLVARVHLTLLRPEPSGSIVTQGGDIDNRLKTLLDALKIPERNALPPNAAPSPNDRFFFCLLEDDNLITDLSVNTKQLLGPVLKKGEVIVILDVETIKTGTLMGGMEFP
jgi:hypothetical protein